MKLTPLWSMGSFLFLHDLYCCDQQARVSCVQRQCCQLCGFPTNLGLFFFVELEFFFEDLQFACFWACFNWNLLVFGLVFCRLLFIQIYGTFALSIYCWRHFGCFCEILLILGLFFQICHLAFLFNFLADFWFSWIFLPTHVGLVFRLNYLFLAYSNSLSCFCKE